MNNMTIKELEQQIGNNVVFEYKNNNLILKGGL